MTPTLRGRGGGGGKEKKEGYGARGGGGEVMQKWGVVGRGGWGLASVVDGQSFIFLLKKHGLRHDRTLC